MFRPLKELCAVALKRYAYEYSDDFTDIKDFANVSGENFYQMQLKF